MDLRSVILVALFAVFFVGTGMRVWAMWQRKRAGGDVERARLVFFFLGCLMLVCLVPLGLFGFLSPAVVWADLAVVAANFLGYALTYDWRRAPRGGDEAPARTKRVYQIYFRGQPYGLITKEAIDVLLAHKLLKRQHTVELVEDFQTQAQRQGVGIALLRNKDGSQTLVRVQGPPTPEVRPER